MAGIFVLPSARIHRGHPWVYFTEIRKTYGQPQPGETILIKDNKARLLGAAIYNPKSQIVARRYSFRAQKLDEIFFRGRIERALQYRRSQPGLDQKLCRLIWSESDGLPGVIVDRYGDNLVLQTLTLAMDQHKEMIADLLFEALEKDGVKTIVERNDATSRVFEGMEPVRGVLRGATPEPFVVMHRGIPFKVDLMEGQKTGLYLDQLDNYFELAAFAQGRRVLDCFTNQGGFALACAHAGAKSVQAIDSSGPALANAASNAEALGVHIEWTEANVFDYLRHAEKDFQARNREREASLVTSEPVEKTDSEELEASSETAPEPPAHLGKWDMIVLDPPSFARNKKTLNEAMRGYKELHLRALRMLPPGGLLATFTCSHHVSEEEFLGMVQSAAFDAKKILRLRKRFGQRPDHPIIASIPETEYLRGWLWEVIPSW